MCCLPIVLGLAAAGAAMPAAARSPVKPPPIVPGTYSNEEQVYFEKEAGRAPPMALTVVVAPDLSMRAVDSHGAPAAPPQGYDFSQSGTGLIATRADADALELRRARPVTCWASLKRDAPKAVGAGDWMFVRGIKLHDQGGRALVGKGEAGVAPVILRMRNVTWAGSGRAANRPSLVLYVHSEEEPDKAVSYAWTDPGAARIGVNLRWMQASCTVDGMEPGLRRGGEGEQE